MADVAPNKNVVGIKGCKVFANDPVKKAECVEIEKTACKQKTEEDGTKSYYLEGGSSPAFDTKNLCIEYGMWKVDQIKLKNDTVWKEIPPSFEIKLKVLAMKAGFKGEIQLGMDGSADGKIIFFIKGKKEDGEAPSKAFVDMEKFEAKYKDWDDLFNKFKNCNMLKPDEEAFNPPA